MLAERHDAPGYIISPQPAAPGRSSAPASAWPCWEHEGWLSLSAKSRGFPSVLEHLFLSTAALPPGPCHNRVRQSWAQLQRRVKLAEAAITFELSYLGRGNGLVLGTLWSNSSKQGPQRHSLEV